MGVAIESLDRPAAPRGTTLQLAERIAGTIAAGDAELAGKLRSGRVGTSRPVAVKHYAERLPRRGRNRRATSRAGAAVTVFDSPLYGGRKCGPIQSSEL
jgi:hypothetical protein